MTPEQWQTVKDKLEFLHELEPSQRPRHIDQIAGNDASLRRELESLILSREDMADDFLSAPVYSEPQRAASISSLIGRRLGPYQIVSEIGQGGMGEVYRALRADDQYQQQVAIKLIRAGRESTFVISRFKNERQILANLDHPNIARLLDGGTTPEGVPYFVMELIEGQNILEYCNRRSLDIRSRLELFLQVCSAVQFAHQRLIIHRDIKPGNILVTTTGIPKLLDFGLAKILGSETEDGSADATVTAFRILTPAYASPEQVRGGPITTASDVYSLGMVLYELLAGRHPFRRPDSSPDEMVRAICESEPARPSTLVQRRAVRSFPTSSDASSGPQHSEPSRKLYKHLRGDLDNIVLMALRKEPQRRYASVDQFAEDIRRYLGNLPVVARKDTARYRAAKFILRLKVGVTAFAAVMVTLIATFAVVVREERSAQRRFNDVRALADSLIFDVHDSIKDLPGSTPARKIIMDRALTYLNSLANESGGDLGLQRELATAYERLGLVQGHYLQDNLGDVKGSLASYQKALDLRRRIQSKSSDWTDALALAESYRLVADLQSVLGSYDEARMNIDHAITTCEVLNREHPSNFQVLRELGFDYHVSDHVGYRNDPNSQSKFTENFNKALATDEAALKVKPDDLETLNQYALDFRWLGSQLESTNPNRSLEYYQRELDILLSITQRSNSVKYARGLALSYRDLGAVYENLGDTARVLDNNAKCLGILQAINRADPQNATIRQSLAIEYVNTALGLSHAGKTNLALEDWRKSMEIIQDLVNVAPENRLHRHYLAGLAAAGGTILMRAHRPEAAFRQFDLARSVYQELRDTGPATSFEIAGAALCLEKMGEAAALMGNEQAAADDFQRALAIAQPLASTTQPDLNALYAAADAFAGLGDLSRKEAQKKDIRERDHVAAWEKARSWYQQSLATWRRIEHPNRSTPGNSLDTGNPALVARELQECEAALAETRAKLAASRKSQ